MRKRWARYTVAFSLFMILLAPAGHSKAADGSVRVTLPDFAVKLNGHTVDNQNHEYPLIVYRDITYIPMTWYDTRLLGLEANWSPETGLHIEQSPVTSSYVQYSSEDRNAVAYAANVPTYAITVNGQQIDQSDEQYPLLSFRDVTYFPLTWRFAHDEFGWDYQWNDTSGLSIASHNPQVQSADLPADASENDAALFRGYYYFVETSGTMNRVFRSPMQQPFLKTEIYAYDIISADLIHSPISFQVRDNTLWFTYHIGGGFTGSDEFVKIDNDGKADLLQTGHGGNFDFRDTSYGTMVIQLGLSALEGGNLYVLPPGQEATSGKHIGDPGVIYGGHMTFNGDVENIGVASSAALIGDDVYVLATHSKSDANKLYKINLKTNQSDKIVDTSINSFQIIDDNLYYVKDQDNLLYSAALDGTGEMKLSDHPVSWFDKIDDNVFYTTKKDADHFELYKADPNGKNSLAWATPVKDVSVLNDQLVCQFGENDDYGIVLLDGSGNLLLKVTDPVSRMLISDKQLLFQSARDSSVAFIQ